MKKPFIAREKGKMSSQRTHFQKAISARAREEARAWPARSKRGGIARSGEGPEKHGRGHAVQTRSKIDVCKCMKLRGTCPQVIDLASMAWKRSTVRTRPGPPILSQPQAARRRHVIVTPALR